MILVDKVFDYLELQFLKQVSKKQNWGFFVKWFITIIAHIKLNSYDSNYFMISKGTKEVIIMPVVIQSNYLSIVTSTLI